MPKQVGFINRENELANIDMLVNEWNTLRFVFIDAEGGIGKTRLLKRVREVYQRKPDIIVTEIIDFDDRTFHAPNNVGRKIAEMLDEKHFTDYIRMIADFLKMEKAEVSSESLSKQINEINEIFVNRFNSFSTNKRVVLCFDTTEQLQRTDFWNYLMSIGTMLENCLILIAGRKSRTDAEHLQNKFGDNIVQVIDLPPLTKKTAKEYLQEKQKIMNIHIESEFADKLVLLADGRPILIDLAVEWWTSGIPIKLITSDIRKNDFERELVIHIAQTRKDIDRLIILMSHVYPLDIDMINIFLNLGDKKRTEELFNEAKTYVFVKVLPKGRITLHDEMRRMVKNHVWTEIDPDGERQRQYSIIALDYINNQISQKNIERNDEKKSEIERLLIEVELLIFKADHLRHNLFINIKDGVKEFAEIFDEATRISQFLLREILIIEMQQYEKKLNSEQLYILNSRRIRYFMDRGYYEEGKKIAENILNTDVISLENQVETLILYANTKIRLGHVQEAIIHFKEAFEISRTNNFLVWLIKSHNALGWAYRLTGDLKSALTHYRDAQNLCLNEMIRQTEKDKLKQLDEEYGLISNNLIFILATKRATHATAIDLAIETIKHWKKTGNKIGLGRCYSALGIVYFRNGSYSRALEAFQSALKIFKDLDLKSELGFTHSWRGATYLRMNNLDYAEKDFKESLTIGTQDMRAMTLYRLGHLYFKKEQWELSEKYLRDSIEHAKTIPDFTYWLLSMARLCMLHAEEVVKRFDEIDNMVKDCCSKTKNLSHNSLGMVYLGLSRILLLQNDTQKKDNILNFLKEGITLAIEHGSNAHTGILVWLELIEKDFDKINSEIIRLIGVDLIDYVAKKEKETNDLTYMKIKPILYQWAKWDRNINGSI